MEARTLSTTDRNPARAACPVDREQGIVTGLARPQSAQQRLARLARWCTEGRLPEAELELNDWRRESGCPTAAIVLLASLWAQRGETSHAVELLENHDSPSPQDRRLALSLLVSLHVAAGHADAAVVAARRFTCESGNEPAVRTWLDAVMPPQAMEATLVTPSAVDHLACELIARLEVIPSLVSGQKIERSATTIQLLRQTLTRLLHDIDDGREQLTVCQALADLAMLAGDHTDARRWAHRGLRIDPYNASMALALSRIEDDAMVGPPAATVLAEAVNAHPKYPDLRAALIRREFADGRADVARRRLEQWLRREPNQAMAQRLREELAA
jgi:tetratricopeptide (TPR) repeat protein